MPMNKVERKRWRKEALSYLQSEKRINTYLHGARTGVGGVTYTPALLVVPRRRDVNARNLTLDPQWRLAQT